MPEKMKIVHALATKIDSEKAISFFGLLLAACICLFFYKTLFNGEPISRFSLIQELDTLYNSQLQSSELSVAQDPSACLQSIPRQWLVQEQISRNEAPIWNPQTGCGQPILADPSNTIFGPVDLLCSGKNQKSYNIGIVAKIFIGALASYALFLRYGASPWAAATAALGYSLSARILGSVELATNFEFLPLVYLSFVCLKHASSIVRILLCSLVLALSYTSLHPEVFFLAVLSASFLWLWQFGDAVKTKSAKLLSGSISFLAFGFLSIAWVSPFIFSFLEYLQEAESYKFSDTSIQFISLLQLPFFLTIPRLSGTLFPGSITLLGIMACLLTQWQDRKPILTTTAILILFACRPCFLADLFAVQPFSYLLPEYALGNILLLLCIGSSVALSRLVKLSVHDFLKITVLSSVLVLLPQILLFAGLSVPSIEANLSWKGIGTSIILLAISIPLLFSIKVGVQPRFAGLAILALPLINLAVMIPSVKAELPITKQVTLPPQKHSQIIGRLQSFKNARISACGDRLLQPNTALLYGLSDLRTCSPLNNKRYTKFMQAMGAKLGYCNMMQLPFDPNKLLDLASVQYLLTSVPLQQSSSDIAAENQVSGRVLPGMRLLSASSYIDLKGAAITSDISFRVHKNLSSRYQIQEQLEDKNRKILWQSPFQWFAKSDSKCKSKNLNESSFYHNVFRVPVPYKEARDLILQLRIRDTWTGDFINADGTTLESNNAGLVLAKFSTAKFLADFARHQENGQNRFSIVNESPDLMRIYKNNNALAKAYLVHHAIIASSAQEALQIISYPEFNGQDTVILEKNDLGENLEQEFEKLGLSTRKSYRFKSEAPPPEDSVKISKESATQTEYICNTKTPAILVLTNTFYPGWQALIDGKDESRVLKANYLFRSLVVPAGRHTISISYNPEPLRISRIVLSFALILCTLFLTIAFLSKARKRISTDDDDSEQTENSMHSS